MRKGLGILLAVFCVFLSAEPTRCQHAHDHPPPRADFLKINSLPAETFLTRQGSLQSFPLPDYSTSARILVNRSVSFEIDPAVLQTEFIRSHNSTIPDARFLWEFGDGQTAYGARIRHTYKRIGSYLVTVSIGSNQFDSPLLFKAVLIHILPRPGYKLPMAIVAVNQQLITDAYKGSVTVSFKQPVELSGSRSRRGSAPIIEYLWSLSDSNASQKPSLEHSYNQASYNATPVLRVTDANRFVSYATVEILNEDVIKNANHYSPLQPSVKRVLHN